MRKGSVIPSLYTRVSVEFLFIGRNRKEFVAKQDDVGLGSANESARFLYRGKLVLCSSKKSICRKKRGPFDASGKV